MSPEEHRRIQDLFVIYRDYLKHEDGLINFRVTWFIATQAAIFAAYGFLVHDVLKTGAFTYGGGPLSTSHALQPFRPTPWLLAVLLLCSLGALSSVTSFFSINAAAAAMNRLRWRWLTIVLKGEEYELLPDLKGGGSRQAALWGWLSARTLPAVSFVVWVSIALVHLFLLPGKL